MAIVNSKGRYRTTVAASIIITNINIMRTEEAFYSYPEIHIYEILTEGVLCSSENANEMLDENEGIW